MKKNIVLVLKLSGVGTKFRFLAETLNPLIIIQKHQKKNESA
jgi:hypothetical protein